MCCGVELGLLSSRFVQGGHLLLLLLLIVVVLQERIFIKGGSVTVPRSGRLRRHRSVAKQLLLLGQLVAGTEEHMLHIRGGVVRLHGHLRL